MWRNSTELIFFLFSTEYCKNSPSHEQNTNFILIKKKLWKIFLFLFLLCVLWFWFLLFFFPDVIRRNFSFVPFSVCRKKSKFKRNFYFCYLFSFDVEVDTNSILLSGCLLDRINIQYTIYTCVSLPGHIIESIYGFVKCLRVIHIREKDNLTSWRS